MAATYDGSPCKKGHGTKRYKANGTCVTCNALKTKAVSKKRVEAGTRYIGAVCQKHPELSGARLSVNSTCVHCHRDRSAARQKKNGYPVMNRQKEKLTEGVYERYGSKCVLCDEDDRDVLTVDHIDQQGSKHKSVSGIRLRGVHLYRWLRANGYPDGFRILCYNCNIKAFREYTRENKERL